jgi:hypothetical protein
MKKTKKLLKNLGPWMEVRFLLALSDGRAKGYMEIVQKLRMTPMPTYQMDVDRLAGPLCSRGLVKHTGAGYKITEAGLAWLKRDGLTITSQVFDLPEGYFDRFGDSALDVLKKMHDL